jgi:hypothetical protein
MLGDQETPTISFHKETKLLIAVGDPAKLETIDAVLKALSSAPTPRNPAAAAFMERYGIQQPLPAKPAEKPKTEN